MRKEKNNMVIMTNNNKEDSAETLQPASSRKEGKPYCSIFLTMEIRIVKMKAKDPVDLSCCDSLHRAVENKLMS